MNIRIELSWKNELATEFKKYYFNKLINYIRISYQNETIYPEAKNIFRSFEYSNFTKTKVVILGQDPYHNPGQADGLAFSVPLGISIPPSLRNIFSELKRDIGIEKQPYNGTLYGWAKQGVLLLNTTLTVQAYKSGSHKNKGWEIFTNSVIKTISERKKQVVFILWGIYAGKKEVLIDTRKHLILKSAHPSPLSAHRGFFKQNHFSKANDYLIATGQMPILW